MSETTRAAKGRAASMLPRAMYTFDECVQRGGPARSTLYKLIGEGRGPEVVKIGRRSYITAEAWDEWLRNLPRLQSRKPKSPAANFLPPSPRRARNPVDVAHAIDKIMRSRGQPIPSS